MRRRDRVAVSGLLGLWLGIGCGGGDGGPTGPTVATVTISPDPVTIDLGSSFPFLSAVADQAGHPLNVAITWGSSNPSVASVSSSGVVTALGTGAITITATAGGVTGRAALTILSRGPKPTRNGRTLWMGPNQFAGLFDGATGWPQTADRLHTFSFFIDFLDTASHRALGDAVRTLVPLRVDVNVEAGGVRDWDCSGASLASIEIAKMNKLAAVGGQIRHLSMDSPFGHALATSIPGNCGYSAERTAGEVAAYMRAVLLRFPSVEIGLIEPVSWYTVGAHPNNSGPPYEDLPRVLSILLDTLAAHGLSLGFVTADAPYDYDQALPGGWAKLKAWQDTVHAHGLRFGLIYNSDAAGRASDQQFYDETLAALEAFHDAGGNPDFLLVESWYPHPTLPVPESQAGTLTNLMKDFIAQYDLLYP